MTTQPTSSEPPETGWTVSDYMELEPEDHRHELIRGRLVVTPSPTYEHQSILSELGWQITTHVKEHDLGACVQAPCDVVLSDETVLQPDFIFVASDRLDELRQGHALRGPPDLVVEVLSPETARRDRTEKRELYAEAGVPWMVIVDPDERTAEVFELADDARYTLDDSAGGDETLTIGRFPELDVELADLWLD